MVEQTEFLRGHPIFNLKNHLDIPLDLSLQNLPNYKHSRTSHAPFGPNMSFGAGRRRAMALRESDLIVAVGDEIRITCLADAKYIGPQERSYKTLHAPNLAFEIRQIAINHNGKLLAVAGTHQVAVLSLPRAGYSKLVTSRVECRVVQVGQFHHANTSAALVSKIDWHPWGKSACTLLVMTVDGKLREYDLSTNPEEPQQTLSFMPDRASTSSSRGDNSAREVVSFCFGKGKADWGPLTVYALTKSGDIWAMCPFMPSNASVPSAYIHALEYFVRAKEEAAASPQSRTDTSSSPRRSKPSLCTLYAYQLKYALSLSKQLPETPSTIFPSPSRVMPISAPSIVKAQPMRQGPFLLQPAPKELEDGSARDLMYLSVEGVSPLYTKENDSGERLGALVLAYSDGKVDVCLDVEKIEAMWESSHFSTSRSPAPELPMMAVYETIDLGIVSTLSQRNIPEHPSWLPSQSTGSPNPLELLQANYPVFVSDPIYEDIVYLYHAFGVHCLNMGNWLQPLANSLHGNADEQIDKLLREGVGTEVTCMLDTFSPELRSSQLVVSVALPSDVYLSYSLLAITLSLEIHTIELTLRIESSQLPSGPQAPAPTPLAPIPASVLEALPKMEVDDPSLVSLLSKDPYKPPRILTAEAITDMKKLIPQFSTLPQREIEITPETLRKFATVIRDFHSHIRDIYVALSAMQDRLMLQDNEFQRQQDKYIEIMARAKRLREQGQDHIKQRFEHLAVEQKRLLARSDRLLQNLMDTSSPVLNEHEKKWFAELKRMNADVLGEGSYDSTSLKARMNALTNKLNYYLPSLQKLAKWEEQHREERTHNPPVLGRSQEQRIMMRLGEHKKVLLEAARTIEPMAAELDICLEKHPTLE